MLIMGIDPGVATIGYAVIFCEKNKITVIDCGCLKTSPQNDFGQRLIQIHKGIKALIKKHQPDWVAVETLFFAKNVKTAMRVSESRGAVILAAAESRIQVLEYTPLQVKQALTGYGRASKEQIQMMVKNILKLKKIPKPDDMADALAIAITCSQTHENKKI